MPHTNIADALKAVDELLADTPPAWTESLWASFIGKSIDSVRRDRRKGQGPCWIRVNGAIRYLRSAIKTYLIENASGTHMRGREKTAE